MEVGKVPQELPAAVWLGLYLLGFLLLAVLILAVVGLVGGRRRGAPADRQQLREIRERQVFQRLGTTAEGPEDRRAEQLVLRGAGLLNVSGGWQNRAAGRQVYDELRAMPPQLSGLAVIRALVRHPGNRQIVFLAVRLGRPAPDRLLQVLDATQEMQIAMHFVNTDVPELSTPASQWCRSRGYVLETKERFGGRALAWGEF